MGCAIPFKDGHTPLADFLLWCGGQGCPTLPAAWLRPEAWARVLRREWNAVAAECLGHWARHSLPLVVTRQSVCVAGPDTVAMGLPAPDRWERQRIALGIPRADVLYFDEFPRAEQVIALLPEAARTQWRTLCAGLAACGAVARVHGSYGWLHLTGLDHVRASSDIDMIPKFWFVPQKSMLFVPSTGVPAFVIQTWPYVAQSNA